MNTYYTYTVFGLHIRSSFAIEELTLTDKQNYDVDISFGKTPEKLDNISDKGVLFQVNKDEFLFRLDSVGAYYVRNGNKIIVERLNNATDDEIKLFLLGTAFGALIHQRGLLPIHGSSVVKENSAIIIAGTSGAGKSSIAATLLKRGYKLIADDISVIHLIDETLYVYPGIPHLKLWLDILEKMQENIHNLKKVRPQLEKYKKMAGDLYQYNPVKPDKIIILSAKNTPGFKVEEITGFEKFNLIKNHTYRYRFLEGMNRINSHFQIARQLAGNIKLFTIQRPVSPILLEELADHIEQLN